MLTWWRNSKKCSSPDPRLAVLGAALALSVASAHASLPAAPSAPAGEAILKKLREDLQQRKSASFATIVGNWEKRYGTAAVPPLLKLAQSPKDSDPDRYIAVMGAAKIGGPEAAPLIAPLLKDKSWMLRSSALRALSALKNPKLSPAVLPLLKDPALVVRVEAVDAVQTLKPAGAVDALINALEHGANYHRGKATWVPQKALAALVELKAAAAAPKLKPLLKHERDPALVEQVVATLEQLTGRKLAPGKPLAVRVAAWEKAI
jgi:HEAT repeat protein